MKDIRKLFEKAVNSYNAKNYIECSEILHSLHTEHKILDKDLTVFTTYKIIEHDLDEKYLQKCYDILLSEKENLSEDQEKVFIAAKSILELPKEKNVISKELKIDFNNLKNYTVVNSYYDKSASGIGDFLRGCCYLHDLLAKNNIDFNIDYSKHSLGKYLHSKYKGDKKEIFDTEIENKHKTNPTNYFYNMKTNLEKVLTVKPKKIWNIVREKIVLFSNFSNFVFMSDQEKKDLTLTNDTKKFMKSNLLFCKEVEKTFKDFNTKDFIVMHYRLGDYNIVKEHKISVATDDSNINTKDFNIDFDPMVDEVVEVILKSKSRVFILSDSNNFKEYLRDNIPKRYMSKVLIPHLQSFHTSSNPGYLKNIVNKNTKKEEKMFYVALDMKICTESSKIISKSVYPWGSGFTYWISKIYDIPITCEQINE